MTQLFARLARRTRRHRPDEPGLIGQPAEKIVQLALESLDEPLGQTRHHRREGQRVSTGKVGWINTMGGDEAVGLERVSDLAQYLGMELAEANLTYPVKST